MSNEFGYIPESPEQSFGNNKGIFTPTDIYDLTRADKYTNYGQLELIETQSITSSTASMIFSNIQENTYNVHFLTYNNFQAVTNNDRLALRFFESGVEESGNVYQGANQLCFSSRAFVENNSTTNNHIRLGTNILSSATNSDNGYAYLYNLGDSAKYSFSTCHTSGMYYNTVELSSEFGSGVLPQTSTVDEIKLFIPTGNNIDNLQASLYGIKEYS